LYQFDCSCNKQRLYIIELKTEQEHSDCTDLYQGKCGPAAEYLDDVQNLMETYLSKDAFMTYVLEVLVIFPRDMTQIVEKYLISRIAEESFKNSWFRCR